MVPRQILAMAPRFRGAVAQHSTVVTVRSGVMALEEVKADLVDEALGLVSAQPERYGYVNRAPAEAVALVIDVLVSKPDLAGQLAAAIGEAQIAATEAAQAAQEAAAKEDAAKHTESRRRGSGSQSGQA